MQNLPRATSSSSNHNNNNNTIIPGGATHINAGINDTPAPSLLNVNSSAHQNSNQRTTFPSVTIPYPTASAGSLERGPQSHIHNQRDPSIYLNYNPFAAPSTNQDSFDEHSPYASTTTSSPFSYTPSLEQQYPPFSSPISPSQQSYISDPFHSHQQETASTNAPGLFMNSNPMTSSQQHQHERGYSSSSSSSSQLNGQSGPHFAGNFVFSSASNDQAASGDSAHSVSNGPVYGEQDLDSLDLEGMDVEGSFVYSFPNSPKASTEEDDYFTAPPPLSVPHHLAQATTKRATSSIPSTPTLSSSKAHPSTMAHGAKEKEQNKQKLYRNRKSEFTNRMRDELLSMNLLPHSRITHAPEIMSKTADTLRDYKELLTLIRENVEGMPENLASVPGAIRKLVNENGGRVFNAPPRLPMVVTSHTPSQLHPKAMDGLHQGMGQFRTGARHGTY